MKMKLENVRLSFPSLFRKAQFQGTETKFEATFLINKETQSDIVSQIEKAIAAKIKTDLKGAKLGADKLCLRDGDGVDYDGYEGHMSLKAASNKRPLVIGKDKSPLAEEDGVIYGGCYVNAIVELWAQDNGFGRRVNANLLGVQFVRDGDAFGGVGESAKLDDFDDLSGEGDDDDFEF
jgi:hypothetical protein